MCAMVLATRASHRLGEHRAVGQRLQRHGVTNCAAASVITTCTVAPALTSSARQLGGLVGGDAAGQAEHDVTAGQLGGGRRRRRGIHGRGDYRRARRLAGRQALRGAGQQRLDQIARRCRSSSRARRHDRARTGRCGRSGRCSERPAASIGGVASPSASSRIVALNGMRSRKPPDRLGASPCS